MSKREVFRIESKNKKKRIRISITNPTPEDYEKIKKLREYYEKWYVKIVERIAIVGLSIKSIFSAHTNAGMNIIKNERNGKIKNECNKFIWTSN